MTPWPRPDKILKEVLSPRESNPLLGLDIHLFWHLMLRVSAFWWTQCRVASKAGVDYSSLVKGETCQSSQKMRRLAPSRLSLLFHCLSESIRKCSELLFDQRGCVFQGILRAHEIGEQNSAASFGHGPWSNMNGPSQQFALCCAALSIKALACPVSLHLVPQKLRTTKTDR